MAGLGYGVRIARLGLALGLALLPALARAGEAEGLRPAMLTRAEWGARPALPGLVPQAIRGVVVHHTGERQNLRLPFPAKLRNLQGFSQRAAPLADGRVKPAWPDLPYHFYVDANGAVAEGRDPRFSGSTNTAYDPTGYVQVVVEGNFDVEDPGPAQLTALRALLLWLLVSHRLPVTAVSTHKDHAATSCPGRRLTARMPELTAALAAAYGRARGP